VSEEIVTQSDRVFEGKLIKVRVDEVRMPDGSRHRREVVEHPGAVAIVPVLSNGDIILVRQYRHAIGSYTLELPAGTREPHEEPLQTAIRELREETGYHASQMREMVRFFVSPGWANEELIVYLATGLTAGQDYPEPDEDLWIVKVAPKDVLPRIKQSEIVDSKTIIGLLGWLGFRLAPD
jgi:8-oxo-dGTP pyrophosphatase MutT (NUDIX family)